MQDYIQAFGVKPVVVVDYLQILDPPRTLKSASDKQVADYNLKRLKVLYLFSKGYRYRKNGKRYPEKPDIVISKHRSMIFVHGCF